ncbi:Uncharacterised protein [Mycobacteroides abscessus subsp. abscessus]|nr:Uncharacterised protein [Mycobacteroides abscessus subsp. abscessus]
MIFFDGSVFFMIRPLLKMALLFGHNLLSHTVQKARQDVNDHFLAVPRDKEGKFFSSIAVNSAAVQLFSPHESAAQLFQHFIAFKMAVIVVDTFEIIYIS